MKNKLLLPLILAFFWQPSIGYSQKKIALLVGVAKYAPETYWSQLETEKDVSLIRESILSRGFEEENILTLTENTTKKDIIQAFRTQLIDKAKPGDVAYFHFSGHGYQIPDDNGDELDGWDESLVTSHAPKDGGRILDKSFYVDYIRDDELGDLLDELRLKLGPTGDVMVSIDACHSGTATRGMAPYRGEPRLGKVELNMNAGLTNASNTESAADFGFTKTKENMANITCYFASSEQQLNKEYHTDYIKCGSLSYSLSKALQESPPNVSYRALFDRVKNTMNSIVPGQTPHLEGEGQQEIFGGKLLPIVSYHKVKKIITGKKVTIDGGLLHSFHIGTVVGFYPPDTKNYLNTKPIAKGKVISSRTLEADVELTEGAEQIESLNLTWIYPIEKNYGDLGISMKIVASNSKSRKAVEEKVANYPFIKITDNDQADMLLEIGMIEGEKSDSIRLTTKEDRITLRDTLTKSKSIAESTISQVINSIISYSQVKLIRSLDAPNAELTATIRIIPYKVKPNVNPRSLNDFEPLDPSVIYPEGSDIAIIPEGTYVRFEVVNSSLATLFYSILNISPKNELSLLAPDDKREPLEYRVTGNGSHMVPGIFLAENPGDDLLKLVVTREPLDLRSIVSTKGASSRGANNSSLEVFLSSSFRGTANTRSMESVSLEVEDVGVYSILYRITK
jgi:metacaspase-1